MKRRAVYRSPTIWAICLGVWAVLWLLQSGSELAGFLRAGRSYPIWVPMVAQLSSALSFALLTPFTIEFALRVRESTVGRATAVVSHLCAMIVFSWLHVAGMAILRTAIHPLFGGEYRFGVVGLEILYEGFKDYVIYGMIIGLAYGLDYYRRYRERAIQAARLQTVLATAQLENLEHRIQPHFLFNTLNMISAVMHEDVDIADRMIARLSDLLRMAMSRRGRQEVPLAEELEMLDAYVDIMRTRFEQRLTVDVRAADGTADALVPPLLLQPLVENAVKYGVARRDEDGHIEVRVDRRGSRLSLVVSDDGPGAGEAGPALLDKGLGLSTTAERLKQLYGDDHGLEIVNGDRGGLQLSITIPFRVEPAGGSDLVGEAGTV